MTSENQSKRSVPSALAEDPPMEKWDVRSQDADSASADHWDWFEGSPGKLLGGAVCGVIFGFLLQKGGVAKFDVLVGVLLLEDFVVVKVMLSAIVVGMVGVYLLRRLGAIELQIKETKYGANIIGGLIFGVGFALLAYCPGTNAAAVGQGNYDALVGLLGLLAGSYVFALAYPFTSRTLSRWGNAGKITLPELFHVPTGAVVAVAVPLLVVVLVVLGVYAR